VIVLGADVNTGDFLNWSHGASAKILFAIKLPAADVATAVWEKVITSITTAGSAAKQINDAKSTITTNLDTTVSSRLATTGYTAPDNANIALIKTETNKIQAIDDNVDAILTDTGTTLPAAIAAISVDLTPVLTAIGLTAEQASLVALFAALDINILKILTDIAALTPSGGGGGGLMAFTTWAALETAMLNDLATGSWRVEEYAVGEQKKRFKSFDEFKKVLTYVQHMAALDAGGVTKTYAKNDGRGS
jgi:hypothetical protein